MKVVLLGNAGAGKTTLSRALAKGRDLPCLSLDAVAFSGGVERRPLAASVRDALAFVESHASWIVEGCYADIVEPLLEHCETLVFLNPGVAACVEHCRRRPWEPGKFGSAAEQDRNLANLIAWVEAYEGRTDEYGLQRHRHLFASFPGRKFEFDTVTPDTSLRILAAEG